MANDNNEINKVKYPGTSSKPEFDTVFNWPATTQVTQNTGEDITRNRNAILMLERILGPNPHIGLFTPDLRAASVSQRIGILEQGVAEGRFEFKKIKVERAIETTRNINDLITLILGAARDVNHEQTAVEIQGPLRVRNSNVFDSRALFDVGFVVAKTRESLQSTKCEILGSSILNEPLLKIVDYARGSLESDEHTALEIQGNLVVTGYIRGNFALDHEKLNNINTDPVIDAKGNVIVDAIHVTRGNFHSHKRGEFNSSLNRWIVNSSPAESTYGIIDHNDIEPQSVRTTSRQQNFLPNKDIAYHVTNGDDHDHVGGDGAPLRHSFLLGIDPKNSDHVTGGDTHTHNPDKKDGGLIESNAILLQDKKNEELKILGVENKANFTEITLKIDSLLLGDRADIDTTKKQIIDLQEQDKLTESDIDSLKNQVQTLKIANNESVAASSSQDASIKALQSTTTTHTADIKALKATTTSHATQITSLNASQAVQDSDIDDLQAKVVTVQTDIGTLQTNVTDLQTNATLHHQDALGALAYSGTFKIKSGVFSLAPGNTTITFETAFVVACLSVVVTPTSSLTKPLSVHSITSASFIANNPDVITTLGTWIAIGH
jgi:hypothetical protein